MDTDDAPLDTDAIDTALSTERATRVSNLRELADRLEHAVDRWDEAAGHHTWWHSAPHT